MKVSALNIVAVLSKIAGLGALVSDVTFANALTSLFGPSGTKAIAAIGIVSVVAGEILHIIDGQPPDPVAAVPPPAPIVVVVPTPEPPPPIVPPKEIP